MGATPTLPYPSSVGLGSTEDGGCLSGWMSTATRHPGMLNIPRETYRRGFSPAPYICGISTNKLLRPAYFIDAGRKLGKKKCFILFDYTKVELSPPVTVPNILAALLGFYFLLDAAYPPLYYYMKILEKEIMGKHFAVKSVHAAMNKFYMAAQSS